MVVATKNWTFQVSDSTHMSDKRLKDDCDESWKQPEVGNVLQTSYIKQVLSMSGVTKRNVLKPLRNVYKHLKDVLKTFVLDIQNIRTCGTSLRCLKDVNFSCRIEVQLRTS